MVFPCIVLGFGLLFLSILLGGVGLGRLPSLLGRVLFLLHILLMVFLGAGSDWAYWG